MLRGYSAIWVDDWKARSESLHEKDLVGTEPEVDAEAWAELSDLYFSQGLYSQAIFALEEVLVLQPNAWNVGPPRMR